jgi:hypothetical protein
MPKTKKKKKLAYLQIMFQKINNYIMMIVNGI